MVPRILVLALVLPWALACGDSPTDVDPLGIWGGEGLWLQVSAVGADLEFDCAAGTVDVPFEIQADGSFRLAGTFTLGTGGPVREGDEPEPQPAVYAGTVDGDRMTLEGVFGPHDTALGPYHLRKGSDGLLRKCQ